MALSSDRLEAFYAIAQTLSFSKAGKQIGITQSAVSQRLSHLEEDLGTSLILRDSTELRLTETGQRLLRYCALKNEMEAELLNSLTPGGANELRGVIRISGFSSVMRSMVIPALAPLARAHPGLTLVTSSVELSELLPLLKRSQADMVLTTLDPKREEMEAQLLGYEENVLVESTRHPNQDVYLDHDENDLTTNAYFRAAKKPAPLRQKRYLDDIYGLLDGVRHGYGRAVLPKHLVKNERELRVLNPSICLKIPVFLIYYRQSYYGKIQTTVRETLCHHFRQALSQSG